MSVTFFNKKSIFIVFAMLFASINMFAQNNTNIQIQYDFGGDRKLITTTVEGFYNDNWGNTFFFIDHDFPLPCSPAYPEELANRSIGGNYWEIARCLNFWKNTKADFFSVQVEYNGGLYSKYSINHAFLTGADFFVHSKDFRNTFNFKLLYKGILYSDPNIHTKVPLQFTFVWNMRDLFGAKGLMFSGFADFWGEEHTVYDTDMKTGLTDWTTGGHSSFVFLSEPQIWYSVGQWFKCPNLNVGGEVELSYDFGTSRGFKARSCLGIKWVF